MASPKIIEVDGNELHLRYPRQTQPQPCYVWLNLEDGRIGASANVEIGNAVPFSVWHGLVRRWPLPCALRANVANKLLKELAPIAQRVIEGHEVVWDGNNHVARLTTAARDAEAEAEEICRRVEGGEVIEWDADEWLADSTIEGLTATSTDDELAKIASTLEADARASDIDELVDLDKALEARRDRLREAAAEAAEAAEEA